MIHAGTGSRAAAATLVLGLVLAGCNGSDPEDTATGDPTEQAQDAETETQDAETETQAGDSDSAGYAVLVVANVDRITAEAALEQVVDAGYDGFQIEGSAEDGYDVFQAGYSLDEARQIADELADKTDYQPMPWEADKLP